MKEPPGRARLYFEAPGRAPALRRALLMSHSFPPDPEVGGLRWQQMVRHFADWGWSFDILTKDFEGAKGLDPARLETLPAGTRVFSVPGRDPLTLRVQRTALPVLRRITSSNASPAQGVGTGQKGAGSLPRSALANAYHAWLLFAREGTWASAAARIGIELARSERYDVVISSGPPHMAHDAARRVATQARLPYVVDMRDPWSLVQRSGEETTSPVWRLLARRHERRVIADASLVTMNTEPAVEAMRRAYPEREERIHVVRNGCDDEALPTVRRDGRFTIRFAGSIYIDRDPRLVFRAAGRLVRELELTPEQFAIEFVGDVDKFGGTPTMQIASEERVDAFVTLRGLVKRAEALEFLAGASMLLSLPQDSDFAIPAKIYEYLRFDAWMLVLSRPHSATARLLEGTDADVIEPADVDGIAKVLRRRYEQFSRGEMPVSSGRDGRFDRRVQSQLLASLIEGRVLAQGVAQRRAPEPSSRLNDVAPDAAQPSK